MHCVVARFPTAALRFSIVSHHSRQIEEGRPGTQELRIPASNFQKRYEKTGPELAARFAWTVLEGEGETKGAKRPLPKGYALLQGKGGVSAGGARRERLRGRS